MQLKICFNLSHIAWIHFLNDSILYKVLISNSKIELGEENMYIVSEILFFHKLFLHPSRLQGVTWKSIRNSNQVMTLAAGGAKGCLDHRFLVPPTYTGPIAVFNTYK